MKIHITHRETKIPAVDYFVLDNYDILHKK